MRKKMSPAFSEKAVRGQEPIVQSHADLLIHRLHEQVRIKENKINMADWYTWATFDIASDLTFGESFNNLTRGDYHPWVSLVYYQPKAGSLVAASRFYPAVETILRWMIPRSILQQEQNHFR